MNKKVYIIVGIIFLLLFMTNSINDKYYINYQNHALTVNNASKTKRSQATIYGDNMNQGNFIESPKTDLPKGNYKIKIKYSTDTDLNFIKVNGQSIHKEVNIPDEEKYLSSAEKVKIVYLTLDEDTYKFNIDIFFCGQGTLSFKEMSIEALDNKSTDTVAWSILILAVYSLIGFRLYFQPTKEKNKSTLVLLMLIGITVLASYPLFCNYLMHGDDIAFHLTRIEGIKNGLLSGQFPVRVHPSSYYNYGYAPSIFYPELFLYFPAIVRLAGVSTTGTVQIFLILLNFLTASIMYFSAYKISKVRSIGILSSILYVFATYHLLDVYARFALGEAIAMAFIPLLIYGTYELLCRDYSKWKYAVLGATGILQSHMITTLVAIAFIGLATIICFKNLLDKKRIFACIKAAIMMVLINLWFLVPFIKMMKEDMNVSSLARDVDEVTLYVTELFRNFAVNGEVRNVIGDNMSGVKSLEIGFPIILGVMLFVYLLIQKKIEDISQKNIIMCLLGFGILSAYATTNLFPWKLIESIPVLGGIAQMIQFPWRLLAFTTAFLSIVAPYGFFYFLNKTESRKIMIVAVFAVSALIASRFLDDFCEKKVYCYKGAIVANTGIGTGEYYYKGTKYSQLKTRGETVVGSSEELEIESFERIDGKLIVNVDNHSVSEQYIEVPLAYYPFYKAVLNGDEELLITKGENNVIRVGIPANSKGNIKIQYSECVSWLISDIISGISIVLFLALIIDNEKVIIYRIYNRAKYKKKIIK